MQTLDLPAQAAEYRRRLADGEIQATYGALMTYLQRLSFMHSTIPDALYGQATEHVRAAYGRVCALTSTDSFFNPCRDPSVAEAIVAQWLETMAVLVNDARAERAVARLIGEPGVHLLAFLRRLFPPPTFPTTLDIAWAEGPWELLVTPDPAEDPELEPWGSTLAGAWLTDHTLERWRDCLFIHHPPLQALVGPPIWEPMDSSVWERVGPPVWEPWAHRTTLSPGLPAMDVAGQSERGRVALAGLSSYFKFVADEFLAFSLIESIFGANPEAWRIAMFEHGLIPLSGDAGRVCVFRYNPEPILTPPWLFGTRGR